MASAAPAGRRGLALLALAIALGTVNGLVFLGFEWVVDHGTDWLWNDVVDSDAQRWRVVPLAIVLSVALSLVLRLVREPRWTPPHVDPLHAAEDDAPAPTVRALGVILLVGAASLLAGASLGPEASLVATATGLGAWTVQRAALGPTGRVLILASAGALLAAFFGSVVPLAIPLVLLVQRTGRLPIAAVVPIVVAGLASLGTLRLIQGDIEGFGQIPSLPIHARDYAAAALLGLLAVPLGALLRWAIVRLGGLTERIEARSPWWAAAIAFGAVLGLLYLAGGESVQFSGSQGTAILLDSSQDKTALALVGIVVVKLVVTAWSAASGYRGGLVFPSVFTGVAVSLAVASADASLSGPGVLIGGVAGLVVEMTNPALGVVMLLALLPAKLLGLGVVAAAAATVGRAGFERLTAARSHRSGERLDVRR